MSENPEKYESRPREKAAIRAKRKNMRQAFKMGELNPQIMSQTFQKYYNWKEKRPLNIPVQQLRADNQQPIFSIALHCGTKNGENEIITDYSKPVALRRDRNDVKSKTTNNFQKYLTDNPTRKTYDDQKRLTFVDFKTKRSQRENFFSYPDVKTMQITAKEQGKRAKTQPKPEIKPQIGVSQKPYTISFRKTGFPRQLNTLKEMIKKLPSVRQSSDRLKLVKPIQIKHTFFNNSSYMPNNSYMLNASYISQADQFNQTLMQSQMEYQLQPYEERRIFRKSKTESIRGYIQQLNEVISYADELIHEENQKVLENNVQSLDTSPQKTAHNTTLSPQPKINLRKYWPQYPRYSLTLPKKNEDEEIAKFFTNFSYADPKLNDELQGIVNAIKKDLDQQERQMNKEIAQSQKNAIELRYKYKMNIEKDNYKRNVKSFLKCKKQYRIERRREEVRANGITRLKKNNRMERAIKIIQKQQESG